MSTLVRKAVATLALAAAAAAWYHKGEVLRKKSDISDKPFMSEWNFVRAFASFFTSALRKSVRLRRCAGTAAVLSFFVSRFTRMSRNRLGLMFFSSLWYIDYLLQVVEVPEVQYVERVVDVPVAVVVLVAVLVVVTVVV